MNHSTLLRIIPWVHDLYTGANKVFHVACDHGEAMNQRSCGDQTINIWQFLSRIQPSPNLRFIKADPKNPALKSSYNFRKPVLKYLCLRRSIWPNLLDTFTDLSHRQDTQKMRTLRVILKPSSHCWIRSGALPKFGNHVGIDEKHTQNSQPSNRPWSLRGGLALRGSFRSKIQSSESPSSPVPEIINKLLIIDSFAPLPSFSAKIRRCSSSAETPCSAARSFSAFTSVSGIFLTSN